MSTVFYKLIPLFLGLCLLAGCNTPVKITATPTPDATATPVPPTGTPTPIPTPTETPIPAHLSVDPMEVDGIKLRVDYALFGAEKTEFENLIAEFNRSNAYGITAVGSAPYSLEEYTEALASGDLPDVIVAEQTRLKAWEKNGLRPALLSDYYEDERLGFAADGSEPILPEMLEREKVNGELRSFPLWHEPSFIFYNSTWAKELGFDTAPTSFAEFAEQACAAGIENYKAKDQGKHGTGGWITTSDSGAAMSWLLNYGKERTSVSSLFNEGETGTFIEAGQWVRNLFDNGCAWNSRLTEPYDYFANRYALFYSGTYANASRQINAFENSTSYADDNWDILPYPRKTKDGAVLPPRFYSEPTSIAIQTGDPVRQFAAWIFTSWLYEDVRAAKLALAADSWPVQDSEEISKLYQNSGKDKLFLTLDYRENISPITIDSDWLTNRRILGDGFLFIFNPSARPDDIPQIWTNAQESILEVAEIDK